MKAPASSGQKAPIAEISLKSVAFGGFIYEMARGELRRGRRVIRLRPRAARTLSLLISRAGSVVTYEELRVEIWGGLVVEWRAGLHQLIRELRKALSSGAGDEIVIETVNRRGYRFRPAVETVRYRRTFMPASRRDYAFLAAGVFLMPILVLAVCISFGVR